MVKRSFPIPGGTNSFLTLTNVQTADAGNYSVIVSNATGSATSRSRLLTSSSSRMFIMPHKFGPSGARRPTVFQCDWRFRWNP